MNGRLAPVFFFPIGIGVRLLGKLQEYFPETVR